MNFRQQVFKIVKSIPPGQVASYGQIALIAGNPRAARQVGWALASLASNPDQGIPWWRVVNKEGYLSIRGHDIDAKYTQRDLLIAEGIDVNENLEIDMQKYRCDL